MINIFCNNGNVYRFTSMQVAEKWLNESSDVYGNDKNNLLITASQPLKDSLVISGSLHLVECQGCGSIMRCSIPENHIPCIICPECGTEN